MIEIDYNLGTFVIVNWSSKAETSISRVEAEDKWFNGGYKFSKRAKAEIREQIDAQSSYSIV